MPSKHRVLSELEPCMYCHRIFNVLCFTCPRVTSCTYACAVQQLPCTASIMMTAPLQPIRNHGENLTDLTRALQTSFLQLLPSMLLRNKMLHQCGFLGFIFEKVIFPWIVFITVEQQSQCIAGSANDNGLLLSLTPTPTFIGGLTAASSILK